jgi:hypothetical protein
MVGDWRDTCPGHGGRARYDTRGGLMVVLQMEGFVEFGPQNSMAAFPEGTNGGMWRHSEGCVHAKQIHVERVSVGLKT